MALDLADFDDDVTPAAVATGGQKMKAEDLSDGKYVFQVARAGVKYVKEFCLLELELEIASPGMHSGDVISHALFIKDKESVLRVCKDLKTLGFDTENWTKANDRPFSQEFPKVLKCLKGVQFSGAKKASSSGGKTYHNIYINERATTDGLPSVFGPEELNAVDPDTPF